MIKELLALTSCVASIGAGSMTPSRNYQHTEDVGNTQVTYKYESNEVNSFSDLIDGNIYYLSELEIFYTQDGDSFAFNLLSFSYCELNIDNYFINDLSFNTFDSYDFIFSIYIDHQGFTFNYLCEDNTYVEIFADLTDTCYLNDVVFIYSDDLFSYFANYLQILPQYTDFNIIQSVTYTPPTTIIGVINEFTSEYLFKDIPYVNDMIFTIGGQEITLMTWLVMVFGLITAVGLFILLFIVFRWLFRMFAGCFKPYK